MSMLKKGTTSLLFKVLLKNHKLVEMHKANTKWLDFQIYIIIIIIVPYRLS